MTQCEGLLIVRSPTGCLFKTASAHLLPVMQNQAFLDAIARALPPPLPRFVRSPEAAARGQHRREPRPAAPPPPPPPAPAHPHPAMLDVLEMSAAAFPVDPLDISGDALDLATLLGG